MVQNKTFITKEGLESLQKELTELKTIRRRAVAERIQEAKELGDLSENAEYTEAKEEQAFVEGKIQEIEHLLKNVTVIKKTKTVSDKVDVGSTVTVQIQNGNQYRYTIVGANEANPSKGRISNESPIGKAFLNHKSGDVVNVPTPRGFVSYTIISLK